MKDIKKKLQGIVDSGYKGDKVTLYGEQHDFHEVCKEHGIELPSVKKPKKQVNTKEDKHADMEETLDEGHSE